MAATTLFPEKKLARPREKSDLPEYSHFSIRHGDEKRSFLVTHRLIGPDRVDLRVQETLPGKETPKPGGVAGGPAYHAAIAKAVERIDVFRLTFARMGKVSELARADAVREHLLARLREAHQRLGPDLEKALEQNIAREDSRERILRALRQKNRA